MTPKDATLSLLRTKALGGKEGLEEVRKVRGRSETIWGK